MRRPRAFARSIAAALLVAVRLVCVPAAQAPATGTEFSALLSDGQRSYAAQRLDDAAATFRKLRDGARLAHDELWEARGLLGLGLVSLAEERTDESRQVLGEALAIFDRHQDTALREIGQTALALGNAERSLTHLTAAAADYERAIAAYDAAHDPAGRVHAEYARLFITTFDRPTLDDTFARFLADVQALSNPDLEAAVLHLWGDRLFTLGAFDAAVGKLEQAAALLEQSGVDPAELGTTYNSLGRLYRVHGQRNVALAYQLKALAIHEKQGTVFERMQSTNAVAATYLDLGDLPQAKAYYERALALTAGGANASPTTVGFLRASYGDLLVAMGEPAAGRAMLAQALPEVQPHYLTLRYGQLASADLALHQPRTALEDLAQAQAHCAEATPIECINIQLIRANAEVALGDDAAALADQRAVLTRIEEQHAKLAASDFLKQGFEQLAGPAYSLAVDLEFRQGHPHEALETAELGRSRALLDLLASRASGPSSPSPARPAGGPTLAPVSRLSGAMAHVATTAELVATAARLHSTLLLYWVGDNALYAWTVAPDGTIGSAVTPMSRTTLDRLIRAITPFTGGQTGAHPTLVTRGDQAIPIVAAPQPAWRELYDALIEPIATTLPSAPNARLTIIPHGPLMVVPFAALRDHAGTYLIERYAIQTAPTGGLFEFTRSTHWADARLGTALLVSNPATPPRVLGEAPLAPLPGAEAEVQAIARLMPGRATVLTQASASEPRVVGALAHASVLHFATHAVVRDGNPSASFLALGRPADGSSSGELTPDKIYDLTVDADLVVLSACRSGGGAPNGDGIAALARAFFYAGASSVVVSVWDVVDAPTDRLLPAFYRAWLGGADKAAALRTAQLRLMADLRAGRVIVHTGLGDVILPEDPMFWAGFVLIGEAD